MVMATREEVAGWYVAALRPERQVSPLEWAEAHRRMDRNVARPGRYRTRETPYSREVYETFVQPGIQRIVLVWGAQLGKTTILENLTGYVIDVAPDPMMLMYPDDKILKKVRTDRIEPMIESHEVLRRHKVDGKRALTAEVSKFTRMSITWASSEAKSSAVSVPIRYLFRDEIDLCAPNAIADSELRTDTFGWRARVVDTSTPTAPDGAVWQAYQLSDKREWWVPCVGCGERFAFQFEYLKWEKRPEGVSRDQYAQRIDSGKVRVWYECPHCGYEHEEHEKRLLNEGGIWVATGEPGTVAGFHLPTFASQMKTWRRCASQWESSCEDDLKREKYVNQVCGLPFAAASEVTQSDAVIARVEPDAPAWWVPPWVRLVTAGVDVQKDRVYFAVWGFGEGLRQHLIAHGAHEGGDATLSLLWSLDNVWRAPLVAASGRAMSIRGGFVDSGYETKTVYDFCLGAQRTGLRVFPAKGNSDFEQGVLVRPSKLVDRAGMVLYHVQSSNAKDELLLRRFPSRMKMTGADGGKGASTEPRDPREESGVGAASTLLPVVTFHAGTDLEFARQFTAEEKVRVRDTRTRRWRDYWRLRKGVQDNHYLDCSVLAMAAASMGAPGLMAGVDTKNRGEVKPKAIRIERGTNIRRKY